MKLPLHPSFLLKIPYFQILFDLRYEGFAEEFTTYFNHNLETNPEENIPILFPYDHPIVSKLPDFSFCYYTKIYLLLFST